MTPTAEQILALGTARPNESLRYLYWLRQLYWFERWIAALALIAMAPALLVIAGLIAVLARRTPLVRHRRVGWGGSELPMLKLRTMWEAGQPWGPLCAVEEVANSVPSDKAGSDPRITSRFAAWCRRYSIDELPQLYHVVRGQMSLVGPRPITRAELDEHYGVHAGVVLALRPGLTGLWQMIGRSSMSYSQRLRLDLWFAKHASPGLYLRILLRSIPRVLQGDHAY